MTALDWLRCPICAAPLSAEARSLACPARHSFDVARQGYVNLLGRAAPANADSPAMLEARARFLATGSYSPVAAALAARAGDTRRVVEVGAGTGYYLAHVLDAAPDAEGLATDVSVAAAKRCARSHERAAAIVADTWAGLPLRDGSVDLLLCVFAPRNLADFARVLRPGGRLLVVVPRTDHLAELRETHGLLKVAQDKADSLIAELDGWSLVSRESVTAQLDLPAEAVADLIWMGPNAFHSVPADPAPAVTTLSVDVVEFQARLR